ncbi:Sip5p [Rhodotorula paludigena]|uniref:Sip5p n=1 Tax=Rhodotorula paludigena TaxID=86838 RepID=UPI0031707484
MGNSQSSHGSSRHQGGHAASGSGPVAGLRSRASTLTGGSSSASSAAKDAASVTPVENRTVVDGGWVEPQSLLYARLEYHHPTVHKLIADRRLAPFYLGLQDFEEDWDVDHIVEALAEAEQQATQNLRDAHAAAIDAANEAEAAVLSAPPGTRKHKEAVQATNSAVLHRERLAETLKRRVKRGGGALQSVSKSDSAKLYQTKALECPICFLYYPPNMVHTRCCDQPICTECFVQIKRAEPTPTHLESEPACCPFCMEPNFGCIYEKPVVRTSSGNVPAGTSDSAPSGTSETTEAPKPRRKSFAHTEKEVVTTDMVHPDWEEKLETMKATVARRANRRIVFRQVGDRLIPVGITSGRGNTDGANPTMSTSTLPPNFLSQIAAALDAANESGGSSGGRRRGSRSSRRRAGSQSDEVTALLESLGLGGGPDLEEMMVQEAMRLSQLEEEERMKKEEEERAKKAGPTPAAGPGEGAAGAVPQTPRTTERLLSEAMGGSFGGTSADSSPARTPAMPSPMPVSAESSSSTSPPAPAAVPPLSSLDVDIPSTPLEADMSTPTAAPAPAPASASAAEPTLTSGELAVPPAATTTTDLARSDTASPIIPPPSPSPSQGYQALESDGESMHDVASAKRTPSEHVENGVATGRLVDA